MARALRHFGRLATFVRQDEAVDVEQLAVNKISDMIARCPKLRPLIDHNDKTPFTDGHVDIYARPGSQAKEDFLGRVPVQVKGRTGLPKDGRKPAFSVSRSDLRGHLQNRGALYFVVYIDPASDRREAYYATLSPFKIDELLREAPPKKRTVRVRMEPVPSDPDALEALLIFAHQTRSEDLAQRASGAALDDIREITIHTATQLAVDKPVALKHSERDFSVVITRADGTVLPVDGTFMFAPAEYVGVRTNHVIRSGNTEFREQLSRRIDEDTVEFQLSPGLRLQVKEPGADGEGSISLQLQDNLGARFSDIEFFLACVDNHSFELNGKTVRFSLSDLDDCQPLREHEAHLADLMELFSYLGADVGLVDVTEISDAQAHGLAVLHAALIDGKEVAQTFEGPMRVAHTVGPWRVELLWVPGQEPGQWKCIDLFGPENHRQFAARIEDDEGGVRHIRVSPYELLDESVFPYTLNLRLGQVVRAFEEIAGYPDAAARANTIVLRLISGADALPARRAEFLDAARDLNEWVLSKDGEQAPHLINKWQIGARTGRLSQGDQTTIRDLKRSASRGEVEQSELVEVSCAILLSDAGDIDYCLTRLNSDQLSRFRTWPIWTLHELGAEALSPAAVDETPEESRRARAVGDLLQNSLRLELEGPQVG